ncbi:MAG: 16S rRNA (uracil(1498)-N(3))-methyltransferase [Rhodospirillaceae bacterium]|jgi:16S rRNA (uracil1498-N3)-methyltransferase|nr:16S rRNA (uracil(1498)-N(3))-methyltransferase [Rhodospirillaceae bacterium]MBT4589853.1 16S rRNA (uracil(1498)-N(3))-methyltransferase [Rhodospirillaceae bacterium]MBT5939157.1 16S rRNA (uracil(1498)-N(3))-methyltransferase [Rhodospirillaceae bacterium]MBT7267436.1 16S rRNA (uracil(1498)-N(3))-methyltransferase [Rhodospirillaceae bacterium]
MSSLIRLYVEADLQPGAELEISSGQLHYLKNVMRLGPGDSVTLFNGRDGEYVSEITAINKKSLQVRVLEQSRPQLAELDIWLLFAPIKKARIDMIAEKATELGVAKLQPVMTDFTNIERVKIDRLRANAIEAAEQCRRLTIPDIAEPQSLARVLEAWDPARRLLVMDETAGGADSALTMSALAPSSSDAILIGPEGGFSSSELDLLENLPFVTKITLGGRILRAETAALVALALWNELVAPKP